MKQILRILLAVGVIAFSASITAVSCGKTADPNNNNNNNSGGGNNGGDGNGGDGNGGGGTPAEPAIVIENVNASVAEVKNGTDIELKASGFPTATINANIANTTLVTLATAPANTIKRAFDIVIKGTGGAAATAGLVLVDIGSRANANAFSTDTINTALNTYSATEQKEGLRNSAPRAADAANAEAAKMGWNIYGGFMNDTAPTSGATDAPPFAFSATAATHPVLFCRTTVSTITDGGAAGAGTAQDATVLTGGQKASCYVGATGQAFTGIAANNWLDTAAGNTFKKKFDIAAAGIKTDAKTIGTMGLAGGAASLRDGLTTAEMTTLTAANDSAFKKFSVSLVKDAAYNFTPPTGTITIGNFDATAAKLGTQVGGNDRVIINASQFPGTLFIGSGDNASHVVLSLGAPTATDTKRIFDLTITGGGPTGTATAGMMLVDGGNRTKFADFSTPAQNGSTTAGSGNMYVRFNGTAGAFGYYGVFIDKTTPTSNDPNTAPFAFSPSVSVTSQPIFMCRSLISTVTTTTPAATTVLTGGQKAECYIAARTGAFTGTEVTDWFTALAGNTNLKKRFYFTVAGIRTDSRTLGPVVDRLSGATAAAKVAELMNGLTTTEMEQLRLSNITAFKKIMVEIVTDAVFTAP